MTSTSFVRAAYTGLTVFALCIAWWTTLDLGDLILGVALMWLLYAAFAAGVANGNRRRQACYGPSIQAAPSARTEKVVESHGFEIAAIPLAIASVVAAVLSTRFLVGLSPGQVVGLYRDNMSAYAEYQAYNSILGDLSPGQVLPYLLLNMYVQGAWMYVALRLLVFKRRVRSYGVIALIVLGAAAIYPSLARGTTFEVFKVGIFLAFVMWVRGRRYQLSFRTLAWQGLILFLGVQFFLFNVASRGANAPACMSRDVCLEGASGGGLNEGEAAFAWLYGYFGHGLHYMSVLVDRVLFSSSPDLVKGLVPAGIFGIGGTEYREDMATLVDMGAMWHPDYALMMASIGVGGVLLVGFLGGHIFGDLERNDGPIALIACFLITLQMISFPVGNFVTVSVEYVGMAIVLAIWYANTRMAASRQAAARDRSARISTNNGGVALRNYSETTGDRVRDQKRRYQRGKDSGSDQS